MGTEIIGWVSSTLLVLTLSKQVYKQWQEKSSEGVSKWLFIGQVAASAGFTIYSWMVKNWVFVVTNSLMLLNAFVGLGIVFYHRRRSSNATNATGSRDGASFKEMINPMHLVQMLLPLMDNEGRRFRRDNFDRVRQELIDRWGGATAFLQAPAEGAWKDEGEVAQDEVVLIEVMIGRLDRDWWGQYREELKRRFKQEELIIRVLLIDLV